MIVIDGKEIRINRETAIVSEIEIAYCELVKLILDEGILKHNRTGVDTKALRNGWLKTIDISKFFPIMETKLVNAKKMASEIQWIHQVQSNVVAWLQERGNDTWNQWVVDEDGIWREYEQGDNAVYDPDRKVPLQVRVQDPEDKHIDLVNKVEEDGTTRMIGSLPDEKGRPRTIKRATWFGKEYAGTIAKAYGAINAITHKPQNVQWTLKNNPDDRRMNISLWQDEYIIDAVLPSCVWAIEFQSTPMVDENKKPIYVDKDGNPVYVDDEGDPILIDEEGNPILDENNNKIINTDAKVLRELSATVIQRSADVPIGLPFNIAQYALLVYMFAKATGHKVGTLNWDIRDVHIYVDQIKGIRKQLARFNHMNRYSKFIQTHTDEEVEEFYNLVVNKYYEIINEIVAEFGDGILSLKFSEQKGKIEARNPLLARRYQSIYERKVCLEHMLIRENPTLELADHDSIFDFSTDYVQNGDPYLKENRIGNKDLVLKGYHPTPFINMPIAQ